MPPARQPVNEAAGLGQSRWQAQTLKALRWHFSFRVPASGLFELVTKLKVGHALLTGKNQVQPSAQQANLKDLHANVSIP